MKSSLLPLLLALALPAQADIYKTVDQNGHVTYSSSPAPGAVRLNFGSPRTKQTGQTASPATFPKIDGATQRSRDDGRRRILEDELASETSLLAEAHNKGVASDVALHEKNIAALRAELARVH